MTLTSYLTAALLALFIDALLTIAMKKRFNLPGAIIFALIWPITILITVYAAHCGVQIEKKPHGL